MIKPEELRLKNWVNDPNYKDVQVVGVEGGTIIYKHDQHGHVMLNSDWAKPIPLTPEWLERFGFELLDNGIYQKGILMLRKNHYRDASGNYDGFSIATFKSRLLVHHVHQLQNLYYALTGEELQE